MRGRRTVLLLSVLATLLALAAASAPVLASTPHGFRYWLSSFKLSSNSEHWSSIVRDGTNGTIFAGGVENATLTGGQSIIARFDKSIGDVLAWNGVPGVAWALSTTRVATDMHGHEFLAIGDISPSHVTVGKFAALGPMWSKAWSRPGSSGTYLADMVLDANNDVVICGQADGGGTGNDWFVAKFRGATGDLLWSVYMDGGGPAGNNNDAAAALTVDKQRNVYVAGWGHQPDGTQAAKVMEIGWSGLILWQHWVPLQGPGEDHAESIALAPSGDVIAAGSSNGGMGSIDNLLVARYRSNGTLRWVKAAQFRANDETAKLGVDAAGNAYVAGYSADPGTGHEVALLAKWNAAGTLKWKRWYGSWSDKARWYALAVDKAGNAFCGGFSNQLSDGGSQFVVRKYSTLGKALWTQSYGSGFKKGDMNGVCEALLLAPEGLYAAGSFGGYRTAAMMKFKP